MPPFSSVMGFLDDSRLSLTPWSFRTRVSFLSAQLWHKILVKKQSLEISFPSFDSRLKQVFVFFRPPEVVNFRLKSLLETTFAHSKQICSFDDGDTHTRSIDLGGSGIRTFRHWIQGLANETWNPKCESRHSPFLARNANENPSSETSRPLATSSLAVGRFAAKKGSLRSQRGRGPPFLLTSI